MGALPTVRVKNPDAPDGYMVINESDYNKDVHELVKGGKAPAPSGGNEIDATEAARELADDAGVDLATIEGSGKDGRITKGDVEDAVS